MRDTSAACPEPSRTEIRPRRRAPEPTPVHPPAHPSLPNAPRHTPPHHPARQVPLRPTILQRPNDEPQAAIVGDFCGPNGRVPTDLRDRHSSRRQAKKARRPHAPSDEPAVLHPALGPVKTYRPISISRQHHRSHESHEPHPSAPTARCSCTGDYLSRGSPCRVRQRCVPWSWSCAAGAAGRRCASAPGGPDRSRGGGRGPCIWGAAERRCRDRNR